MKRKLLFGALVFPLLLVLLALQEVKADTMAVYLEGPLPIDGTASFAFGEENFYGYPRGWTLGFLIPRDSSWDSPWYSKEPTIAFDIAFSEIVIDNLNFDSAATTNDTYSRKYNPERIRLSTVEIGGRGYPTSFGAALIIAWGEWEAKNRTTGLTETDTVRTLGLKMGGNASIGENFLFLADVRLLFDPVISLFSFGAGYRF